MNLTGKWRSATYALAICSGTLVAPAAAQSGGDDDVQMQKIVIALPNGKRIVRYVPRPKKASVPLPGTGSGSNPTPTPPKVTPPPPPNPPSGGGGDSGDGSGGGGQNKDDFTPPDAPDDLARQIAQWLEWYRAGDMRADENGDGKLNIADYTDLVSRLRGTTPPTDPGAGQDAPGDDAGDPGTPPTDESGWTDLAPSPGSRVIYVSNSRGNDSNDGLSEQTPVRSISRGISKLRDGHPDWLLLRRGDTFTETFGRFAFSGKSESEPMVISAYGEGPRPKIISGASPAVNFAGSDMRQHLAFVSLEFRPGTGHPAAGFRIVTGAVEDLLIEDCFIKDYKDNIVVQGELGDTIKNVRIRRNLILDARGNTHAQGIYASHTDGLLVEGNIIDRNGWDYERGRDASATIFAHNCYMQRTAAGLVFKDNIVMRGGSHGIQARHGGIIEDNIFFRNPMSIMFGNEGNKATAVPVEGTVKRNVILEGTDISSDLIRGDAIILQNTASVEVTDNIISHNINEPSSAYGISIDGPTTAPVRNALIADNIISNWDLPFRVHGHNAESAVFRDNVLYDSDDNKPLIKHRYRDTVGAVTYLNNHYLSGRDNGQWFTLGSTQLDLQDWQQDYDGRAQEWNGAFADENRSLDTYAQSLGMSGVDELIQAMRAMRKGAWDERLTAGAIEAYFREGFEVVGSR
ncbi:MAG TPA: hypothetical protein ENJ00_07360 [Phycisphaerales bacterium]|nr:hypothetical protein [Phycisphaerales bacterium]